MAVSVAGVAGREMPGLKAALKSHRDEWAKNGEAVLNLLDGANGAVNSQGEPLTENDPRPAYQHAEFPRMVYHAKNGDLTVYSREEMDIAAEQGYRKAPYPVLTVAVADPGVEKANLKRELEEKQGQLTTLADQLRDTNSQMAEMRLQMAELLAATNSKNKKVG